MASHSTWPTLGCTSTERCPWIRLCWTGCSGFGVGMLATQPASRDRVARILSRHGRSGRMARRPGRLDPPTPWFGRPHSRIGVGCCLLGIDCAVPQTSRQLHACPGCFHHRVQRRGYMVDDSRRPHELVVLDGHRCREHLPLRKKRNAMGALLFAVYTLLAVDGWFDGISWFTLSG